MIKQERNQQTISPLQIPAEVTIEEAESLKEYTGSLEQILCLRHQWIAQASTSKNNVPLVSPGAFNFSNYQSHSILTLS